MMLRPANLVLLAAALATAACDRQTPSAEQAQAPAANEVLPDEVAPRATAAAPRAGEVDRSHKGEIGPKVTFRDPAGQKVTLAQYKGRPVLVNLWATWCAPCIKEMPSLDTLASRNPQIKVLAVSQDMETAKVAPFFAERKLASLAAYVDPDMGLSLAYRVNLPTTILYDAKGLEVWRVSGALDWAGPEAAALIAEAG